jgi:riboflavin biosynthesis pyrimidine reductase
MPALDDIVARYALPDRTLTHVRVNFIASIDGAATHDGVSGPLNDPVDKQVFDALRMLADVVVVAAGTVRDENYGALRLDGDAVAWRAAHGLPEHPRFAIVSKRLGLDPGSRTFAEAPVRPLLITPVPAPDDAARKGRVEALSQVADVIECGEENVDLRAMAVELGARGLPQILSEGGPALLGSMIEQDALDELDLTIAPVVEGGEAPRIARGGAQTTRAMHLEHAWPVGSMVFLRYTRAR